MEDGERMVKMEGESEEHINDQSDRQSAEPPAP